jgi:predicted dehydrogenase
VETRTIRWGILGTGAILPKIIGGFRLARNLSLVAIASRDAGRVKASAAQWNIPHPHTGYESLLAAPDVDAVFVALPNHLHREWTVRALEAGKHVLCEKPLACTSAEVEQMFAATHRCQRWLMEGFMYRFHPQIAEAKRRVDAGAIGKVVHVRAYYQGLQPAADNSRLQSHGGGALLDLGCYCVNLVRLFAGEPVRLEAEANFHTVSGVDLTLTGRLSFDGATAEFVCSFELPGRFSAEITGTEGRLLLPHPWRPQTWPAEFVVRDETVVINPPGVPADPLVPFALEIEHLSECIRASRPPQFPPGVDAEKDSRANMKVLAALAAAARS